MKKIFPAVVGLFLFTFCSYSQKKFSNEVKKYIEYDSPVIVLRNTLLVDGKGNPAKLHQTVIINNGKIGWIGDDSKAIIPKEARVIDLNGKAVMPGFVMLHEHMFYGSYSLVPGFVFSKQLPISFPRLYLASGATTIRTCGSIEPYSDIKIKNEIDSGILPGPSMELTAPYLEGKRTFKAQMKQIQSPEEAASFVNYWADQGMTSFKAYQGVDKPVLKAAIDAAHKRGLKVTGHLNAVTFREAAEMGIDHLEHGFFVCTDFVRDKKVNEVVVGNKNVQSIASLNVGSDSAQALIRYLVDKKVGITSTLAVIESLTTSQSFISDSLLNVLSPDAQEYYLRRLAFTKSRKGPTDEDKAYINTARMEKMFSDLGGLLTVGTDPTGNGGTFAGYGNWRTIELLVEADGFTPLEAIKIATLNGAIALGFSENVGTVETGKIADLIIVDGDPSKNISDIRKTLYVLKNGVVFNSKKLFDSVKGKVGFY
jgi:imidazolonepropionase-like amidohydrolase